jgi:hypothetical protein
MFGPSGVLDRADAAVVRRVDVANLEPARSRDRAAGPERRQAPLVRHLGERVGLVHELRQLELPKNSWIAAITGLALIRSFGMAVVIS